MKSPFQLLHYLLVVGTIAAVSGCVVIKINTKTGELGSANTKKSGESVKGEGPSPNTVKSGQIDPSGEQGNDIWLPPFGYTQTVDPAGNSGTLTVAITSLLTGNGGQACFPASQGWDRYFPLPRYILGPGVTPNAVSFTNTTQVPRVTIRTCDPLNGTTLQTGIVIYEEFHPAGDKQCVTNVPGACLSSGLLTVNQRPIANGLRYRATVYFKNNTLPPLSEVKVIWDYQ